MGEREREKKRANTYLLGDKSLSYSKIKLNFKSLLSQVLNRCGDFSVIVADICV